jgi:hypothetical protein
MVFQRRKQSEVDALTAVGAWAEEQRRAISGVARCIIVVRNDNKGFRIHLFAIGVSGQGLTVRALSTGRVRNSQCKRVFGFGRSGKKLAPEVGLEPTTHRLTADCSTIELLWNPNGRAIYKSNGAASNSFLENCIELRSRQGPDGQPLFCLRPARRLPSIANLMAGAPVDAKKKEFVVNVDFSAVSVRQYVANSFLFAPVTSGLPNP